MSMENQTFPHPSQELIGAAMVGPGKILSELKSPGFDAEALWERVDCDLDLLRDLEEIFHQEFPGMLGSLEAAVQQGSAPELAKAAHKIKGSLLQFSGTAAAAVAQALEESGKHGKVEGAEPLVEKLKCEVEQLMKSVRALVSGLGMTGSKG